MYEYDDYFNPEYRDVPYRTATEELEDYLRLLDMVLEEYLEYKSLNSEEKLFSRGLVITESEMKRYFGMPPYLRERDVFDPALAEAAEKAWEYIENRTNLTLQYTAMLEGRYEPDESENMLAGEEEPEEFSGDREEENSESVSPDELSGGPEESMSALPDELTETEDDFYEGFSEIGILWIDSLKRIFSLDRAGVMAVLLALAFEYDRRYERIFGYLQDDISRTRPTVGLLKALMARMTPEDDAEEFLMGMPDQDLFTSLFVSSEEKRGFHTELVMNPLMIRILAGQPDDDMQMPEALSLYSEDADIPLFFEESQEKLLNILSDQKNRFCYIECEDEDSALHMLNCLAREMEAPLYVLDMKQMLSMSGRTQAESLADLSLRLRLSDGLLCVRFSAEEDGETDGNRRKMADRRWRILERLSRVYNYGCVLLFGSGKEPGELIIKSVPFMDIPMPDMKLRTEMWSYFLKDREGAGIAEDVDIEDLADCYDISYSMIRNTVNRAGSMAGSLMEKQISRDMILDSLRQLNQVDFFGLASYVRAAYTWDDITISDDQRAVLRIACDRYRLRNRVGKEWGLTKKNAYGNGVSILLYGPPGTGKTMSAQVIANELGIPLYRVDISRIFSKYIGETEKNLSVIFDAAKGSNVILFFDEADALFSKRTEVGTSNDKYANSETAYLLQKIEEYDGMSILATNLYNNFDTAFVRRITYAVRLDSPDEEARYNLWITMLPETAKLEPDIPFRFLAKRFELSGANIKAILFGAAYMAGAEGKPVGMAHIVRSMEYEYRKLGRFIDREAFGPYAVYLSMPGKQAAGNNYSSGFDIFS